MRDDDLYLHPASVLGDPAKASTTGRWLAGMVVIVSGFIGMSIDSIWLFLAGAVAVPAGIVFIARPTVVSAAVAQCLLGVVVLGVPTSARARTFLEDVSPSSHKWYFVTVGVLLVAHAVFRVLHARVRVPSPTDGPRRPGTTL